MMDRLRSYWIQQILNNENIWHIDRYLNRKWKGGDQ